MSEARRELRWRVVTYNLGGGRRRGLGDLDAIARALQALRPDVVACQEVLEPGNGGETAPRTRRLATALGMEAVFAGNFDGARGLLGNALLARTPLVEHDNIDVSWRRREPRGIQHARSAADVDLFNVHFGLSGRERALQGSTLLAVMESDRPAISCGDFNDWSARFDRAARRRGWLNALRAGGARRRATFPARWAAVALDRIYVRDLRVVAAGVLRGGPWTDLSDHLPVMADVERVP